ncbi:uncharacterized protein LOC18446477 [Amborella trichopoda]|nr:uncharacterized protein LOC18446477 [Amborella trichopoda]|eukprot:XP_006856659.3 uncharacterized protein LOC18446477 [Amborella trichopoda]
MELGFKQDMFAIEKSKKSLLVFKILLLCFIVMYGVSMCVVCLNQMSTDVTPKYVGRKILPIEKPCEAYGIEPEDSLYVHYPQPTTYGRAECKCTPVRFFAIVSMQRSGSGWLETLLNSHPNISSNGEIFSVKERRHNVSSISKTLDKIYNLEWTSSAAKNECTGAVGLKWMLNQGLLEYHEEIVKYFNQKGVSVIFLFRRNLLHRLISLLANAYDHKAKQLNGKHRSHVHSIEEAEVLAKYKPTINHASLLASLKDAEDMTVDAMEYFNSTRHIILYYEDLINNQKKLMEVQEFLWVPLRDLQSRQVKIHTRPISKQVENWLDVYNTLKGTHYEVFLNQPDYPSN